MRWNGTHLAGRHFLFVQFGSLTHGLEGAAQGGVRVEGEAGQRDEYPSGGRVRQHGGDVAGRQALQHLAEAVAAVGQHQQQREVVALQPDIKPSIKDRSTDCTMAETARNATSTLTSKGSSSHCASRSASSPTRKSPSCCIMKMVALRLGDVENDFCTFLLASNMYFHTPRKYMAEARTMLVRGVTAPAG